MIRIVALGPGDPDAVPAAALAAIDAAPPGAIVAPPLDDALREAIDIAPAPLTVPVADGAVVVAPDAEAHAIARDLPGATTLPSREALRARAIGARVAELATVATRLRAECPWDRVQTAATIVPHTVEEAFEVAEAVASGDPAHQADEIGDLLFQSVFLAALLEEDGHADLAAVARGQADKLISRHPHVYGDRAAADLAFEAIKEVGPNGHFFGADHTQERYTTAFYSPFLSDWRNFEAWQADGGVWASERANKVWKDILGEFEAPPMDEGIRAELQAFVERRKAEGGAPTDF